MNIDQIYQNAFEKGRKAGYREGYADATDANVVRQLAGEYATKMEADEAERVFLAADKAESLDSFNNTPLLKQPTGNKPEYCGSLRI